MPAWFHEYEDLFVWGGIASVVMFVGTLIVVPIIIARMGEDYFMPERPRSFADHHPIVRSIGIVLKNLAGVILVIMGLIMIFVPGQGFLTILMGLALLNFPGKEAAELKLVRYPPVRRSIQWIRQKAKKPPLNIPES
jgi:hypothetical protein